MPAPSVIHPELLENQEIPSRLESSERLSCAELIRVGEQNLNINQRVAVEIGGMLTELLLTNSLRRFATYFDLESGTSRSLYTTPEHLEKALQAVLKNKRSANQRKNGRAGK